MSRATPEPHGVPGQLNVCTLDVDSHVTGYGAHSRVVVFLDRASGQIEMREDFRSGLPESTDVQRRKVANDWRSRLHGRGVRLEYLRTERADDDAHAWHYYAMRQGRAS